LFHAYWNIGGIKGKAASKTVEGAEAKAKDALRKIHRVDMTQEKPLVNINLLSALPRTRTTAA